MELRNVGRSGLKVSVVGLGCNNFGGRVDDATSARILHQAIDLGVTLIDTSDAYGERSGSEKALGAALGERRKDIVLATKVGRLIDASEPEKKGSSRGYIMSAVEASLRRLKTDWIDLYQLHFPDPLTPIEETLRALDDVVRQGKVRYIGVSNFKAWQVVEASWTSRHLGLAPPVAVQDELSIIERNHEKELIPAMAQYGLGLIAYRPLASGILSGKYQRNAPPPPGTRLSLMKHHAEKYLNDRNLVLAQSLEAFARARGHSLIEVAFAWLKAQPIVSSFIPGASTPEQVRQNVAAAEHRMSQEDLAEINRLCASDLATLEQAA